MAYRDKPLDLGNPPKGLIKKKFGGIDVFENTTPMAPESSGKGALSGQDPNDAGVDISTLPGMKNWGKLL